MSITKVEVLNNETVFLMQMILPLGGCELLGQSA